MIITFLLLCWFVIFGNVHFHHLVQPDLFQPDANKLYLLFHEHMHVCSNDRMLQLCNLTFTAGISPSDPVTPVTNDGTFNRELDE